MLANTPKDWTIIDNKLHRHFVFNNFSQAFAFMTQSRYVS